MRFGGECFKKLVRDYEFDTVLDIGSGAGEQADEFRHLGKKVVTVDIQKGADQCSEYPNIVLIGNIDAIWCCHVLEHQSNVGDFLGAIWDDLEPDGILAITVPPFRQVVPGHVTMWNAGLLLYNLVLAGFDCSEAAVKTYDYNISVIVRKGEFIKADNTMMLEDLAHFFPVPLTGERPGKGVLPSDIVEVNW